MEEALRTRFRASAALAALVATRVDWIERPQGTALPAVTLQLVSTGREYTYGGASATGNPRVQVDCWGRTYREAKTVARAVIAAAEQRDVHDGVRFGPSFIDAERDMPPEDLPGGVKVFRVSIDIIVWNSPA